MFLEYYSKFDWGKYCVTLDGPVPLSSLANFTGESYSVLFSFVMGITCM